VTLDQSSEEGNNLIGRTDDLNYSILNITLLAIVGDRANLVPTSINFKINTMTKYSIFASHYFLFHNNWSKCTNISLHAKRVNALFKRKDASVKLDTGICNITTEDISAGKFTNPLFLFEGSNSTFDFTGVTINIETEVMRSFGNVDFYEMQVLGNRNVISNLTLVDIGSTAPFKRATSIVMDGQEDLIDGLHMTVRGSYPYDYGDIFGKGEPTIIKHHKHSALLMRGFKNHIKGCTIIHRAYGHAIFMQAADEPLIEDCYVEGEVRSTDDILEEEGSGSDADKVNFESIWGYRLPPGFMIGLQEGGIRAYNAGTIYINGDTIQRAASNVTVLNCTVVNMRAGVTLAHAKGYKYVEGTTVLGCESGFAIGTGQIVNCSGDAKHGALCNSTYDNDRE
jgi:hypothetical protein